MENVFTVFGGVRSYGVFEGREYDKIKFTALVNSNDGLTFGSGKPVVLSFNTANVLDVLALSSFSELCLLKFPLKIKVFYDFNSSGLLYASGFVKIN